VTVGHKSHADWADELDDLAANGEPPVEPEAPEYLLNIHQRPTKRGPHSPWGWADNRCPPGSAETAK
jgi:hypothetical protein